MAIGAIGATVITPLLIRFPWEPISAMRTVNLVPEALVVVGAVLGSLVPDLDESHSLLAREAEMVGRIAFLLIALYVLFVGHVPLTPFSLVGYALLAFTLFSRANPITISSSRAPSEVEERLQVILREVAEEHQVGIIELVAIPDQVHLLVVVDPQFGIHRLVPLMKRCSSHHLREGFPWLKNVCRSFGRIRTLSLQSETFYLPSSISPSEIKKISKKPKTPSFVCEIPLRVTRGQETPNKEKQPSIRDMILVRELYRRATSHRKTLHGQLVNFVMAIDHDIKTRKLSYKAFQKMYARSISVPALHSHPQG